MNMIQKLKYITEKKIGFKIKTRGDCHKLSDLIHIKINQEISYNTLRRIFGLVDKTIPQMKTLNILALFNGFDSYTDFINQHPHQSLWALRNDIYKLMNQKDKSKLIDFLNSLLNINEYYIDLLVSIIRELALNNEITVLKKIFDLEIFNPNRIPYLEQLYLGNSVGLVFREREINYLEFKDTKHFTTIIFTIFVDYSSLNKNYGQYAKYIFKTTKNQEFKLFSGLLLQFLNFLNHNEVSNKFDEFISNQTHPILLSRYMSIKILGMPTKEMLNALDNYKNHFIKNESIDYVYELMFTSILTKNFTLMNWISLNFVDQKTSLIYYKEWHYEILILVNLFLGVFENKKMSIKKQLLLLDNFKVRYSYEAFFNIYICILKYHLKVNQRDQLLKYQKISNDLGHPIFTDAYFIEYFD